MVEQVLDIPLRYKAPFLLLVGSLFGFAGFLAAFSIGLWDFTHKKVNFLDEEYASGYGYWPATVSEMVHDWNSPQGRIFFGCCLISAMLYMISWYPFELRNVYAGPEQLSCGCFSCYWNTFRHLTPALGLLLLICVSTVPTSVAVGPDNVSIQVHLLGASMMFVGYAMCEVKNLALCGFGQTYQQKWLDIEKKTERPMRVFLIASVLVNFFIFCGLQGVFFVASTDEIMCCHDTYVNPALMRNTTTGSEQPGKSDFSQMELYNTASGYFLLVKVGSYATEVLAGLSLLASHLAVWYYCEERQVEYGLAKLKEVYDEENEVTIDPRARE